MDMLFAMKYCCSSGDDDARGALRRPRDESPASVINVLLGDEDARVALPSSTDCRGSRDESPVLA